MEGSNTTQAPPRYRESVYQCESFAFEANQFSIRNNIYEDRLLVRGQAVDDLHRVISSSCNHRCRVYLGALLKNFIVLKTHISPIE